MPARHASKARQAGLNPKWFDQLTTLSQVEGQIQNPKFKWPKHLGCHLGA